MSLWVPPLCPGWEQGLLSTWCLLCREELQNNLVNWAEVETEAQQGVHVLRESLDFNSSTLESKVSALDRSTLCGFCPHHAAGVALQGQVFYAQTEGTAEARDMKALRASCNQWQMDRAAGDLGLGPQGWECD